jgi:hypothetical protein
MHLDWKKKCIWIGKEKMHSGSGGVEKKKIPIGTLLGHFTAGIGKFRRA